MKKLIQYLHVNKQKGCWTVHNSQGCFHLTRVEILVPVTTVHKPLKKDNPRYFMRCRGTLHLAENGEGIIT